MSEYVVTAKLKGNDEPYLSAIFESNKLVGLVQNSNISSELESEDIAKFLLLISNDEFEYPTPIKDYIMNHTSILPAITEIADNFIELDF